MTSLSLQTQNAKAYNTTPISILSASKVQTMSSQEIAELTGKRHPDVKRDIDVMAEQLNLDVSKFAHNYFDSMNRQQIEYALDKDLTICLVSGYNVQLRMAIIKRWNELEAQLLESVRPSYMIEDPVARAKKWIEEQTAKQEAETKLLEAAKAIEEMKPTVDAYDLIAGKKGSMCFQDAYKLLGGIKLKDMKQWLFDNNWLYKDRFDRDAIGYYYLMNGYLVEKATAHKPQIRITYKGLANLARRMKIKLNAEDFK